MNHRTPPSSGSTFPTRGAYVQAHTSRSPDGPFTQFRQDLGRAILLGLEFLVAADIIRTVAIVPTLNSVLVLWIVVLIRTFLSTALEVELQGR